MEFRWLFANADDAKKYLDASWEHYSEQNTGIAFRPCSEPNPPSVGSDCRVFLCKQPIGNSKEITMYNFLFRVDRVVVKYFSTSSPFNSSYGLKEAEAVAKIVVAKIERFLGAGPLDAALAALASMIALPETKEQACVAAKTLLVYVNNVLARPRDDKFRRIGKHNKAFLERVNPIEPALRVLLAMGWTDGSGADVEFRILPQNADLSLLRIACGRLQQLVEK